MPRHKPGFPARLSPSVEMTKTFSKRFIFFCYVIWDKFMIFLLR
ncbi:hypothetical protein ASZ90_005782 [hydrocarbon metagenome]|uniref:Uncharacterized protein n=1 Tax=hydrocarbon metagenome TaxID=938273 RepID=A0A0W8FTZ6_9ZZZZ